MDVYLLIHDDRDHDMGDTYVRGAYLTFEAANGALVSRTPNGRQSKAWLAHDECCCSVVVHEVLDAPVADVREDDPPASDTGGSITPQAFIDDFLTATRADSMLRKFVG